MEKDSEWGPEIEHDGAKPNLSTYCRVLVSFEGDGLIPSEDVPLKYSSPNWYWRWQRVRTGRFTWEQKRVCYDPAYAPITAYRIRRPRGMKVLLDLLENLPDAVAEPIRAEPQKVQL